MRSRKKLWRAVALVAAVMAAAAAPARADDYPTRPIQLLVPVPPGGASDIIARLVGAKLAEALGQPVVITNRGGASGTIASADVAKAQPDGYTLLFASITTHGIGPHLHANLSYDTTRDFTPVALVATLPLIMTVNTTLGAKSVADVIALAKAQPGTLAYASSGTGGAPHLAGELFRRVTGTNLIHVPYRGSAPAVVDVAAGRIAVMFDAAPSLLPSITAGRLRPLAAASAERNRLLPDTPTFAELGYRGIEISLWFGIVAPAGTPAPIIARLNAELDRILAMPDIRAGFAKQGADPGGGSPGRFADFMHDEYTRWGTVVKEAHITAE